MTSGRSRFPVRHLSAAALVITWSGPAAATPSSILWTNLTTDVQANRSVHIGVDNYFTVFRKAADGAGDFPTDFGLTFGVLPWPKFRGEIGIDLLEPSDHPVLFNAKLGTPEGAWFEGSPAASVGIFGVGTRRGVTNLNVGQVALGKTIPGAGRLFVGGYIGNDNLLRNTRGEAEASGVLIAFDRGFAPVRSGETTWNRFTFCGDYAAGKNALGGGSIGLYWNFASNVTLGVAPVWFNEPDINGKWKITTQLDVNVPF